MRPTQFLAIVAATALLAAPVRAQTGLAGVSFTSYGTGCTFSSQGPPMLSGTFDPTSSDVTLTLTASASCCNTFLTDRFLVVSLQPASIPLPFVGPSCTLLVQPDLILATPASAGNSVTFNLPPSVPPGLQIYVQGANRFFTTIGFTVDFEMSNGLEILVL